MGLSWKELLRLYSPYIAYGVVLALGAVYTFGYRNGIQSILIASATAGQEAKCGH
jgi:hypothetical protein